MFEKDNKIVCGLSLSKSLVDVLDLYSRDYGASRSSVVESILDAYFRRLDNDRYKRADKTSGDVLIF